MYGVMYIYHFVKLLFLKAICKILLKIEYFKKMYIINKGALAIQVKQISVGGTSNLWPTVPALGKNGGRGHCFYRPFGDGGTSNPPLPHP